ncbi:MAG: tyrosine recombinase XerC [Streptosporangiaceae bacterium]
MDADELREVADLWLTRLRNDGKAGNTIAAYRSAVRSYLGVPGNPEIPGWPGADLSRAGVEAFTAAALDAGLSPTTAELRCTALRSLSAYLAAEDAIPADQLEKLKAPKRVEQVINGLSAAEIDALITACKGTAFADRRDLAIVRLMSSSGVRCNELLSMILPRLDMRARTVVVHGKGSRERRVPFGGQAGESLAWYLRARKSHPHADLPAVWLGGQGKAGFSYNALFRNLRARADRAGIEGFHPHRIRHSFAAEWLRRGGSESGLQRIAGWSGPEMLQRYIADRAAELALEEARRLGIGD